MIIAAIFSSTLFGQTQKLSFDQIGLSLELPESFKLLPKQENDQKLQRGADAIEKENDIVVDMSELITLFAAAKDKFSYVTATIEKFDEKANGPYATANKKVKDLIYLTFEGQIKNAKLDSSSSMIILDGTSFERYEVSIGLSGNKTLKAILISRLYKGYDLGISYAYIDEKTKSEMDALISSICLK